MLHKMLSRELNQVENEKGKILRRKRRMAEYGRERARS